jgi:hypothetical protein
MKKSKATIYKNFSIEIAGRRWQIHFERIPDHLGKDAELLGLCALDYGAIYVPITPVHDTMLQTFWHEFTHLATRNISDSSSLPEESVAECVGEALAEALPQILKKAPWLLKGFNK